MLKIAVAVITFVTLVVPARARGDSHASSIPSLCLKKTVTLGMTSPEGTRFDQTEVITQKVSQFDQLEYFNLCVDANGKLISIEMEFLSDGTTDSLFKTGKVGPELGDC